MKEKIKFFGIGKDYTTYFFNILKIEENKLSEECPVKLQGITFGENVDLVVYDLDNPAKYVEASKTGEENQYSINRSEEYYETDPDYFGG